MIIEGKRIILRSWNKEDVEDLVDGFLRVR